MIELLDFILKNITTQPDEVKIEESQEEDATVYNISVHPDDMGRVIGKSGKVINSIRTLVRVAAIRNGVKVRINLIDREENGATMVESPVETEATMTPSDETATKKEAIVMEHPIEDEPMNEENTPKIITTDDNSSPTVADLTKPKVEE